jgi:hypothetical protein
VEIYSRHRPIQRMDEGKTLRILDDREFNLRWTADAWKTVNTTASSGMPNSGFSPVFSVDLKPPTDAVAIEWTLQWKEPDSWLGYNVKVEIEAV